MSKRNSLLSSASWSLISKVANILVKVFAVIYLARILGPSEFGIFTLIISTVTLFAVFVDLGISPATARLLAEDKSNKRRVLTLAIKIIVAAYLLFTGIFLLTSDYFFDLINAQIISDYQAIFLILIILLIFQKFYSKCFEGLRRVDLSSKVMLAFSWAPWGLAILSVFVFGATAKYAIVGKLTGTFLIVAGLFYLLSLITIKNGTEKDEYESITLKKILTYALPMLVTAISFYIYTHSDILIIQGFLGETEVGIYGVAVRMLDTLHVPAAAIGSAAAAYFISVKRKHPGKTSKLFYETSKWTLVLFFPLTVGLVLTADDIFPYLFGVEYSNASLIAIIYAPTLLAKSLSATYSLALDYLGYSGKRAVAISISAILNIGLNLLLIPKYGIVGAAITTQITYLPLVMWYTFTLKNLTGSTLIHLFKSVSPIINSGLIMGIFILSVNHYMSLHVIVTIATAIIIYITAVCFLGVIKKSDFKMLKNRKL